MKNVKIDNEIVKKYVPESILVTGMFTTLAGMELAKKRYDALTNAYSESEKALQEYRVRTTYNRKWYVRFCRWVKHLFV